MKINITPPTSNDSNLKFIHGNVILKLDIKFVHSSHRATVVNGCSFATSTNVDKSEKQYTMHTPAIHVF